MNHGSSGLVGGQDQSECVFCESSIEILWSPKFSIFFQFFFYFKFFKFLFSRLCLVFVFQRAIRFMRNSFNRNTTVPSFSNGPKPKRQTPNHNLYSQLPNSVLFIQKEIRGNYPGTLSEQISHGEIRTGEHMSHNQGQIIEFSVEIELKF